VCVWVCECGCAEVDLVRGDSQKLNDDGRPMQSIRIERSFGVMDSGKLLVSVEQRLHLFAIGADNLVDFLVVFDVQDGGQTGDLVATRQIVNLVNVDLEKDDVWVLFGQLLNVRSQHSTWSTPFGEKIHHNQTISCLAQLLVEFRLRSHEHIKTRKD
jgi:hypothetical protein